jgi:hypothetical protein
MSLFEHLVYDGSESVIFDSEKIIVREVSSFIPTQFIVYEGSDEPSMSYAERELIQDNLLNRGDEPEDAILADSAILQQLITRAQQEAPSLNWEQVLDEL